MFVETSIVNETNQNVNSINHKSLLTSQSFKVQKPLFSKDKHDKPKTNMDKH